MIDNEEIFLISTLLSNEGGVKIVVMVTIHTVNCIQLLK